MTLLDMDVNSPFSIISLQKYIILSSCSGCAWRVLGELVSSPRENGILQYALVVAKENRDKESVVSVVSCVSC